MHTLLFLFGPGRVDDRTGSLDRGRRDDGRALGSSKSWCPRYGSACRSDHCGNPCFSEVPDVELARGQLDVDGQHRPGADG
jgi:hypothetical protein